ncbi:MAG: hypothetical protein ACC726_15410, partial [Chloroflexota bacterium]
MASRLEITHGLVAEQDRLPTSADSLSITRPTTGSKTRSKGVLFVVVGSNIASGRAREATKLVAETIRREYYYDESAGVPICLEKAIKTADRRLRDSREGAGLPPGSLGVAAAVIRNNELYLATIGAVETYLIRNARLLMPERSAPAGLPAGQDLSVAVWRGELNVGDALLMVSRNMTETVGTEELKSAVLTLHPQAAVEHIHHLFVAAGGEGSDAIIAVEASEQTTRASGWPLPAAAGDSYGDLPGVLTEPVGGAMGTSLLRARGAMGTSLTGLVDRAWDAMPRRQARPRELTSRTSRAETQRRAAIGAMALVGVVLVLGLYVILGPSGGDATRVRQVAGGDSALALALDRTDRADNLLVAEPGAALGFYREAWDEIERARATGLSAPDLDELERRVRLGLDSLYRAETPATKQIAKVPSGAEPAGLVKGPRGGAYYIDENSGSVIRVNTNSGKSKKIVTEGDKPATGGKSSIGVPVQLEAGGPDVVVVDDKARPWRWRPSSSSGSGTLQRLTLLGGAAFGEDHGDVAAYTPPTGEYRLYVVEPSRNQIMRYQQAFDGSAFQEPTSYLATQDEAVAGFAQVYVDFDVYALTDNALRRYRYEKYDGGFALEEPPDAEDLRPGQRYQLVSGAGSRSSGGRIYLYDAEHGRIVGFSKQDGSYLGQWIPAAGDPQMTDVRGMYIVPGKKTKKKQAPDKIVWVSPEGLFQSTLPTRKAAPKPTD